MRKILLLGSFILLLYIGGCASSLKSQESMGTPPAPAQGDVLQEEALTAEPQLVRPETEEGAEEEAPVPHGMIFAKTDFQGIVKTSYVMLSIADQADQSKTYQLYIGDKTQQQSFPWKIQTVKPGYFFINLPVGRYRIHAISIPVSTTVATEPMDITFDVELDKVIYMGTLKVSGTKERIKLGGVPVIKPGFEYTAELMDEREEAMEEFHKHFPDLKEGVEVRLMYINRRSNIENQKEDI